jgi:hypothetical protein
MTARRATARTPLEHVREIIPRVFWHLAHAEVPAVEPTPNGSCAECRAAKAARFDLFCPDCRAKLERDTTIHGEIVG